MEGIDFMKKIKNFLFSNIKIIGAFTLGFLFSITSVYAIGKLVDSKDVGYNNSSSGLSANNVQNAILELYKKMGSDDGSKFCYSSPKYFDFTRSDPSSSSTNTTDYTTLGKKVFQGLWEDGAQGICIDKQGKLICFNAKNGLDAEKKHMEEVFAVDNCQSYSGGQEVCNASCETYGSDGIHCTYKYINGENVEQLDCTIETSNNELSMSCGYSHNSMGNDYNCNAGTWQGTTGSMCY